LRTAFFMPIFAKNRFYTEGSPLEVKNEKRKVKKRCVLSLLGVKKMKKQCENKNSVNLKTLVKNIVAIPHYHQKNDAQKEQPNKFIAPEHRQSRP
jgi:hypothetical protein